jgi:hypothetical protein
MRAFSIQRSLSRDVVDVAASDPAERAAAAS